MGFNFNLNGEGQGSMKRTLLLSNGTYYTPNGVLTDGHMSIAEDGRIAAIGAGKYRAGVNRTEAIPGQQHAEVVDCTGLLVLPGFIDVHVHGGGGFDMLQSTFEGLDGMSQYHAGYGTTAFLATSTTASLAVIEEALRSTAVAVGRTTGAELVGIHLEGPYLNEIRRGAQNKDHIRLPDIGEMVQLLEAAEGHIRLVTLAPEVEGGFAAARWLTERGITASAGHSNATYAEVEEAVRCGVNHTTHHFNGMSPFHHRDPSGRCRLDDAGTDNGADL